LLSEHGNLPTSSFDFGAAFYVGCCLNIGLKAETAGYTLSLHMNKSEVDTAIVHFCWILTETAGARYCWVRWPNAGSISDKLQQ